MRRSYFPFGSGARTCVAWRFATMEAVFALASVAQRWRLEALDPAPPAIDSRGVYRVRGELPLRVRERRRG